MFAIGGAIVSTIVGSISLYIASKVTHTRISGLKIVLIAFLAQLLLPFLFSYMSSVIYLIPFSTFVFRLFVWIGLVKFMAQKVSIIHAILMGTFAFGISYFFGLLGIETYLQNFLFG